MIDRLIFFSVAPMHPADLQERAPLETEHGHHTTLAARLMYMVTHDNTSNHAYQPFLQRLQTVVPLGQLQPMDVLWLVKTVAGLGHSDDALIVFAFDEVRHGMASCRASMRLELSVNTLKETWLQ
jgi:hypothetical protein